MANINKVTSLLFPSIMNETLTVNQIAQNAYENDIENIQNNLMMDLIQNKYVDLLETLFKKDCILCLPIKTLFKKSDENQITEDYISSYILKVTPSEFKYETLNGKKVVINGSIISTDEGFLKRNSAQIIFENDYTNDTQGYSRAFTIYFIDSLLIDLKKEGSYNDLHHSTSLNQGLDIFGVLSDENSYTLKLFTDRTMDNITQNLNTEESIKTEVENLFNFTKNMIEGLSANALAELIEKTNTSTDSLVKNIEQHVHEETYDIVFFKLCSLKSKQDTDLMNSIASVQYIDLPQIGLSYELADNLDRAVKHFKLISTLRTPMEKIKCLTNSIRILMSQPIYLSTDSLFDDKKDEEVVLSADQLIPLVLLLVLRSNVLNLMANLCYMKDFSMTVDVNHGEQGFALSTLEAVFLYLKDIQPSWIDLSKRNFKLWDTLITGSLEEFKALYNEEEEKDKKRDEEKIKKENNKKNENNDGDKDNENQLSPELPSSLIVPIENVIESKNKEGNDLVLLAAQTGKVEVMKFLVEEKDHSLYTKNYEGNNPMHLAILNDNKELIKYLSSLSLTTEDYKKKHMDYQDSFIRSSSFLVLTNMLESSRKDGEEAKPQKITKILMNKQNHERVTPQMLLIKNSKQKLLDCFQNEYLDLLSINEPSFTYDTPLILACKEGHYDLIKFLINHGADCCFQNPLGNTAFHYADETSIKILLDYCQDWNKLDMANRSQTKPDPNIKNKESITPIIYHCLEGHNEIVKEMLNYDNVDITSKDLSGRTCLHYACYNNGYDIVEKLISKNKIDINSKTIEGNTPLHSAVYKNNLRMVELLLKNNADPTIKNNLNKTPKAFSEDDDIINLLDDYILANIKNKKNEKFAKVTRGIIKDDTIMFYLKSGKYGDLKTITTVQRSLFDFIFLRQQLLFEYPHACITSLKDFTNYTNIISNNKLNTGAEDKLIKKCVNRVNKMLSLLMKHEIYSEHELFGEFLLIPTLDLEMINDRTNKKCQSLKDQIFNQYPFEAENLDEKVKKLKIQETKLNQDSNSLKQISNVMKKLSKSHKELCNSYRRIRYAICKPSSLILENKKPVINTLRKLSHSCYDEELLDIYDFSDLFSDLVNDIYGAKTSIPYYEEIAQQYQNLANRHKVLSEKIRVLEEHEKNNTGPPADERLLLLNNLNKDYDILTNELHTVATMVNFVTPHISVDLKTFNIWYEQEIASIFAKYITREIEISKSNASELKNAINIIKQLKKNLRDEELNTL
ncbi:ankyrin [Anaeromyces robustus]|uniref:Ankyrin n=1 Tax=Anaeromyces robustus TaxID=1754192 RepID=A0A1Y1WQH2_9FUNG|nr:ankyrin [Anaeromyces robustus]|eukprot:ORX75779.1 ankyrin [Anaeromyces robustus]